MDGWIARWYVLVIATVLYACGAAVGYGFAAPSDLRPWVGYGANGLAVLLAIGAITLRNAPLRRRPERRAWRAFAAGAGCFALANAYWLWAAVCWMRPLPPGWFFALFALGHLALWAGVLLRGQGWPSAWLSRGMLLFDLLLALVALTLLGIRFGIAKILLHATYDGARQCIEWGYPAIVLLTVTAVLVLLARPASRRERALREVLAACLLVITVADTLLVAGRVLGTFRLTPLLIACWTAGYLGLGAAAMWWKGQERRQPNAETGPPAPPSAWGPVLPILLVLVATGALLWPGASALPERTTTLLLGGLLLLVTCRLLLALAEHARTAASFQARLQESERLVMTDALTGLRNKRALMECLEIEMARASRYKRPLALLFTDIDFFKLINDAHGHPVGDRALRAVGLCLQQHIRNTDIIARFGGEEFVLLLPETPLNNAAVLAERLRLAVEEMRLPLPDGGTLRMTISLGIGAYPETADSPDSLLAGADHAMNHAKDAGRNRVMRAEATRHIFLMDPSTLQG